MKLRRSLLGILLLALLLLVTASLSLAREAGPADAGVAASARVAADPDVANPSIVRASRPDYPLAAAGARDRRSHAAHDWQIETIDKDTDVGRYSSLALDSLDRPYVSYYDAANGKLKVASHNGSTWWIETVTAKGMDYGEYTSLDLDSSEEPYVAFYGSDGMLLQVAYPGVKDWEVETADAPGGEHASLALGPGDVPHISHYDPVSQSLLYVTHDGVDWQRQILASGGKGEHSSLALDLDGDPHMAYYDRDQGNLMYAALDGGVVWLTSTVDISADDVGRGTSIAVDSTGNPHISYVDVTNEDLKYAYLDGSSWQIHIVETKDANVTGYTSLALDGDDRPHIAYTVHDGVPLTYGLRYATYNGSIWSRESVDNSGSVGPFPSIALDNAGYPRIAYYHAGKGNLKYAVAENPCPSPIEGISLAGPATVLSGTNAVFTATVSPAEATTPITYHWQATGQSKIEQALPEAESTVTFTWSATSTKVITVTAFNCGGSGSATTIITVEEPLPDLVLTDVWEEEWEIWYHTENEGDGTAPGDWHSSVEIDSVKGKDDHVSTTLGPGGTLSRAFSGGYACTSPQDVITVCVDSRDEVTESDETNNCRQETWFCDTEPPEITYGPVSSATGTTTATVYWETDEPSDSVVKIGRRAGITHGQLEDADLVQVHTVTLNGLEPSTVYHYAVESTDGSGNTVASDLRYFETDVTPDAEDPAISSFQITHVGTEQYEFTAAASDNVGVERVEFYLDDVRVGTCYTAAADYRFPLDLSRLGMARDGFYAPHTSSAVAVDRQGLRDLVEQPFTPPFEPMKTNVSFRAPDPNHLVHAAGSVPSGTFVEIEVYAVQYQVDCRYVPDPRTGFKTCLGSEQDVDRVEFYVDGVLEHISDTPSRHVHTHSLDLGGQSPYAQHTISATAVAADGSEHHPPTERTVTIVPGHHYVWVRRSVARIDHMVQVTLTIGNGGLETVILSRIEDRLRGFHPVTYTEAADHRVAASYEPEGRLSAVTIDLPSGTTIPPGERIRTTYLAVPILNPAFEDGAYAIGHEPLSLSYTDSRGDRVEAWDLPTETTDDGESLGEAVARALAQTNYLIVTDPLALDRLNPDTDAQALMTDLAELARRKDGLLAFLESEGLEAVEAFIEQWSEEMGCADDCYLLLVGENDIVPAFDYEDPRVPLSDAGYADETDDGLPDLIVGRLIGGTAAQIHNQVQTSLSNPDWRSATTDALLTTGLGNGQEVFASEVEYVSDLLDDEHTVSIMHAADYDAGDRLEEFRTRSIDADIILFSGHGWLNRWDSIIRQDDFPLDLGESHPFAFANTCLAGLYGDDDSIARAFMDQGAGVYLGGTAMAPLQASTVGSWALFENWSADDISLGEAFRAAKRSLDLSSWGEEKWSLEFNLYGDPKFGGIYPSSAAAAVHALSESGRTGLALTIPQYHLIEAGGLDFVRIPGTAGQHLMTLGEVQVPIYVTSTTYADGYQVQGVSLVERSGLYTTTGFSLPIVTPDVRHRRGQPRDLVGASTGHWYPEADFDWHVTDNPDGTSELHLTIYPFYYQAATGNVKFYRNYSLDIDVITSSVSIDALTTGGTGPGADAGYAQGDTIPIEMELISSGAAQDVIADVEVLSLDGETLDGLPLRSLKSLAGRGHYATGWDSDGFGPGWYRLKAKLRDAEGRVLDRESEEFRLGIYAGEVTTFTVTPTTFENGDAVDISLVFSNTGTVPISGTAVIRVQDGSGETVEAFRDDFGELAPGSQVEFADVWDTSGAAIDTYTAVGYVLYDSRATALQSTVLSNERRLYLPLALRDA